MSTSGSREESAVARTLRRAATIFLYAVLLGLLLVVVPFALPVVLVVDWIRRRPLPLARVLVFFVFYLAIELVGLAVAGALWLRWRLAGQTRESFVDANYRLQWWWGSTLGGLAFRILSIGIRVEDPIDLPKAPVLFFIRHASVADTILAVMLVSTPYRRRLRYVLKRELLWDPCLDIVGNRLPNVFADRGSHDREAEIAAVGALAENLGDDEGVLIYPEGTRFSRRKRERALAKIEASGDADRLARAASLTAVLPPRLGGPLELLRRAPGIDAVFCAHTGLEGSMSFADLFNGGLVGRTVKISFWTVPAAEIPTDDRERELWLYRQWRRVDEFVKGSGETSAENGA